MAGHKTLNYWPRIHALQMAGMVGTSEALWLDPAANLTCGCVSNVFIVRDGKLITPAARGEEPEDSGPSPVRPGITRGVAIECAEAAGIECERKSISVDELLASEEVFLTNSSWQLLPVKGLRIQVRGEDGAPAMQSHAIGEGEVGPISTKLRHDLLELIDQETRDLPADR
jgi:branched-chain amino acid aminotransferase